jgi:ribosome-associated toxin RatA of RatAB toxin-antitoxin module
MGRAFLWLLLGLACAPWSSGSSAAAEPQVRVEAHRDGDAVLVEGNARLSASLEVAWDVLTGYDRYAEFVPDLKSSNVIARAGNTALVEQKGEMAFFFLFHYPVEVRLEVTESPKERVVSRAVAGNFREMTGTYVLIPDGEQLRFIYSGRLVPDFRLPPLVGLPALRAAVERQFRALVREILRRAAGGDERPRP